MRPATNPFPNLKQFYTALKARVMDSRLRGNGDILFINRVTSECQHVLDCGNAIPCFVCGFNENVHAPQNAFLQAPICGLYLRMENEPQIQHVKPERRGRANVFGETLVRLSDLQNCNCRACIERLQNLPRTVALSLSRRHPRASTAIAAFKCGASAILPFTCSTPAPGLAAKASTTAFASAT